MTDTRKKVLFTRQPEVHCLPCGCAAHLRCRNCSKCHRCQHEMEELDNGFARLYCDDGYEKVVPPELTAEL